MKWNFLIWCLCKVFNYEGNFPYELPMMNATLTTSSKVVNSKGNFFVMKLKKKMKQSKAWRDGFLYIKKSLIRIWGFDILIKISIIML